MNKKDLKTGSQRAEVKSKRLYEEDSEDSDEFEECTRREQGKGKWIEEEDDDFTQNLPMCTLNRMKIPYFTTSAYLIVMGTLIFSLNIQMMIVRPRYPYSCILTCVKLILPLFLAIATIFSK